MEIAMKKIIGILICIAIVLSAVSVPAYFPDPDSWTYVNTAPGVDLKGAVSQDDLKNVRVTTDFDINHEYYSDMYLRVYYNDTASRHDVDVRYDFGIKQYGSYDTETGITTFNIDLIAAFGEQSGYKTYGFVIYYANTSGTKISDWTWRTIYITDCGIKNALSYNSSFDNTSDFISMLSDEGAKEHIGIDENDNTLLVSDYSGELSVKTSETDNNDSMFLSVRYKLPSTSDAGIRPVIAFTDSGRAYTNGTNGISIMMHQASTGKINFTGAFKKIDGQSTDFSAAPNAWIDLFAVVGKNKMDYILWYQNKDTGETQRKEQKNLVFKTGDDAYDTHSTQLQGNPSELLGYVIFNTAGSNVNIDYMYAGRIAAADISDITASPAEIDVQLDGTILHEDLEKHIHISDENGNAVEPITVTAANSFEEQEKIFGYGGVERTEKYTFTNTALKIIPQKYLSLNKKYTLVLDADTPSGGNTEIGKISEHEFVCTYPPQSSDYEALWAEFNGGSFDSFVKNTTDTEQNYYSIISEFDKNKLISQKAEEFIIPSMTDESKQSVSYIPDSEKRYEGYLLDKKSLLSLSRFDFATQYSEAPAQTVTVFDKAAGVLSVSESTDKSNESVTAVIAPDGTDIKNISASDINGRRVCVMALLSDSDGKISKNIQLDEYFESGDYALTLLGNTVREYRFSLVERKNVLEILEKINNDAKSGSDIYNILLENADNLKTDITLLKSGGEYCGEILFKNRPSAGYTYDEFFNKIESAMVSAAIHSGADKASALIEKYSAALDIDISVLSSLSADEIDYINDFMKKQDYITVSPRQAFSEGTLLSKLFTVSRYSELESIISENSAAYGTDMTKYNSLEQKHKENVWKIFYENIQKIERLSDVKNVFDSAVDNAKNIGDNIKNTGGGSSGGGSSSSKAPAGGSPVASGGSYNLVIIDEESFVFPDVDKHWGKEAITALYDKHIIDGYDDGNFRPDSNITRAEFIKITAAAFAFDAGDTSVQFEDVNESDWYYSYVKAAAANGIILGDGKAFNPVSPITRQDAAVILYRIIKNKGLNMLKQGTFNDEDEISDYAAEAVKAMSGASLIEGSENKFNPQNNLTRAEAAKMIYNVMNYLVV